MPEQTITARLADGPCKGDRMEVALVAGRPPMTLDLTDKGGGGECRYCLDALVQNGDSAVYTFLYRV